MSDATTTQTIAHALFAQLHALISESNETDFRAFAYSGGVGVFDDGHKGLRLDFTCGNKRSPDFVDKAAGVLFYCPVPWMATRDADNVEDAIVQLRGWLERSGVSHMVPQALLDMLKGHTEISQEELFIHLRDWTLGNEVPRFALRKSVLGDLARDKDGQQILEKLAEWVSVWREDSRAHFPA